MPASHECDSCGATVAVEDFERQVLMSLVRMEQRLTAIEKFLVIDPPKES